MATATTNRALRKPDTTDLVNVVSDLNENFDKIDEALGPTLANRVKENRVNTLESRTNVAYGALATAQSVIVKPVAGMLRVTVACGAGSGGAAGTAFMSFSLSGGNVRAVNDDVAVGPAGGPANSTVYASRTALLTGLANADTTVTALFRSGGADTASFIHRQLIVEAIV